MITGDVSPRIFGVGLNKTGTTTLARCGEILGLRCTSCDRGLLEDYVLRRDFSRIRQRVARYDLFEDWPWPLMYAELDRMYPGSKFILTVRESAETWLESLKQHALKTHPTKHCRKLAYGYSFPHRHQREHMAFYRRHNHRVRRHFSDRPSDFIELCWERGDGFEELCTFLGRPLPAESLPHANRGDSVRANRAKVLANRLLSLAT